VPDLKRQKKKRGGRRVKDMKRIGVLEKNRKKGDGGMTSDCQFRIGAEGQLLRSGRAPRRRLSKEDLGSGHKARDRKNIEDQQKGDQGGAKLFQRKDKP